MIWPSALTIEDVYFWQKDTEVLQCQPLDTKPLEEPVCAGEIQGLVFVRFKFVKSLSSFKKKLKAKIIK